MVYIHLWYIIFYSVFGLGLSFKYSMHSLILAEAVRRTRDMTITYVTRYNITKENTSIIMVRMWIASEAP